MNASNKSWRGMNVRGVGDFSRAHRLAAGGAGYTGFVRTAKYLLPLGAIILMGVVAARLNHNPMMEQLTQIPSEEQTTPGQSELVGARYEGVDEAGKPFTLTADKAMRVMDETTASEGLSSGLEGETVDLVRPRAEMNLGENRAFAITANEGRYEQESSKLNLTGGVTVEDGRGNELYIDRVDVDLDGSALVADTPVRGSGPSGTIDAEGLRLEDGGDKVIFTGRTTLTLPGTGASSLTPATPESAP